MQKNNGMKLVVLMLMVVVIAAGLSACSGKNGNDSKTRIIKDGAGREVKIPNKVKRVSSPLTKLLAMLEANVQLAPAFCPWITGFSRTVKVCSVDRKSVV